jgi:hypothetical protein
MAHALREIPSTSLRAGNDGQQLPLYRRGPVRPRPVARVDTIHKPLCAGCRAREARYGFRDEAHPQADRPQTLCFDCFRMEIARRQAVAAQLARGWNASQVRLPLEDTLNELSLRRRRAQIAARHALE